MGLVRGPKSERILPVKIAGEVVKILFYTWGHEFEVEFANGKRAGVKPEAVKLGGAPN